MKSHNRIRRELMASPNKPRQRPRENRQTNFLHVLTQAESIQDACAAVGVTCLARGQSSNREKEVHTSVATPAADANQPAGKSGQSRQAPTPTDHGKPHAESARYRNPNVDRGAVAFFINPDKTDTGQARASPHTPRQFQRRAPTPRQRPVAKGKANPPRSNPARNSVCQSGNPQIRPLRARPAYREAGCHSLPMAHTIVGNPFTGGRTYEPPPTIGKLTCAGRHQRRDRWHPK